MILENKRVVFAQVTGNGDDDGRYKVAIAVNEKDIKAITKERNKVWGNKEGEPKQSMQDWLSEDENTKDTLLWLSCNAKNTNPNHDLNYIVGDDDNFTMKDFSIIGTNSKVTIEFNMFNTTFKSKPNIGRAMIAVQLLELVPFEGGATPTTLKGKKLSVDGTSAPKKKDKKKDKKK